MKNREVIEITHCSPINIIAILQSNKVEIYNVQRVNSDTLQLEINKKMHSKIVEILQNKCYNINVVKYNGTYRLFKWCLQRLGFIVGAMVVIVFAIIFSRYTFNINVLGIHTIDKLDVIKCLKEYGVSTYKVNHFDNAELEKYIASKMDNVSMVSVINVGNTITINIKEKLPDIDTHYSNMVAPQNMLVTSINVLKGTPAVKVGDIVKRGQVLVYAHYTNHDGQIVQCEALANVVGDTWFSGVVEFSETQTNYVRTGKKQVNNTYYWGNKCLGSNGKQVAFEHYETQMRDNQIFSNLFLPFRIVSKYFYETKPVVTHCNFADYEKQLVEKSYSAAKGSMPTGYVEIEHNTTTKKIDDKYVIATYIKSVVEVNNVN